MEPAAKCIRHPSRYTGSLAVLGLSDDLHIPSATSSLYLVVPGKAKTRVALSYSLGQSAAGLEINIYPVLSEKNSKTPLFLVNTFRIIVGKALKKPSHLELST